MNAKKCCKVGTYGTIISGLCCLGIVGVLLGLFGATAAIAYVNEFGDFVFLPAYGAFATLLIYGMLMLKKNWITYLLTIIIAGFAVYFSLSLLGAALTGSGIILGVILIKLFGRVKK